MAAVRAFGAMLCLLLVVPAAAADVAMSERYVAEPVFRGEARLVTAGLPDAPPVVLVHGIGARAAADWDGLIPELARDYRVLAFDLPGFGRSSKRNEPYTPANYAAFVRHVIEREFGARPVRIVGHSLGGAIALRYAALYPEQVTALVLVDVPGLLHRMAYSKHLTHLGIDFLPNLYPAQNDHLRNLATSIIGMVERMQPTPEAIVVNPKFRKSFLNEDPAKIAGLALALEDFSADLPRVTMPTLLLWGGRDEIAPLRNAHTLAAMLPNAVLEVFAASGHSPMDEVPASFNSRVRAFLADPQLPVVDTLPVLVPVSARNGSCRRQRNVVFEGDYDTLVISRCRGVLIRNARVRLLRIDESAVHVGRSAIGGRDGGLMVDDARVSITASRIEAPVAIRARGARLDIAGSRILGSEAALAVTVESQALFSLSELTSPHRSGRMHGVWRVRPGDPL
jgi:pimeloyl-ACP methyl ester carboxylesterase